jgi:hypothetical protein
MVLLTTKFLEVAKFTTLTPLSLLILCYLSFLILIRPFQGSFKYYVTGTSFSGGIFSLPSNPKLEDCPPVSCLQMHIQYLQLPSTSGGHPLHLKPEECHAMVAGDPCNMEPMSIRLVKVPQL